MNDTIKQVIEARKTAIFNSYNITDKAMLNKIEDLFKIIYEFAQKYNDLNEFEAEFAKSPLNSEYTNIFVDIAKKEVDASKPGLGEMVAERVGNQVKNRIMPSRAVLADERDRAIRNIPIIGDVVNAKQKMDFFNKFRKRK